jgi:hypothetical protein
MPKIDFVFTKEMAVLLKKIQKSIDSTNVPGYLFMMKLM